MRQRAMIAMGLGGNSRMIIADEPTTTLDVTVQAQILELLKNLTRDFGTALIIITHNHGVVARYADRVNVMYAGKILEIASRLEIYHNPLHPYTKALLSAVPIANPRAESQLEHILLKGEVPSPLFPPSGCTFHPRCESAIESCSVNKPQMKEQLPGYFVSCHLHD